MHVQVMHFKIVINIASLSVDNCLAKHDYVLSVTHIIINVFISVLVSKFTSIKLTLHGTVTPSLLLVGTTEKDINVEYDCTGSYHITQIRTGDPDQSGNGMVTMNYIVGPYMNKY